MTILLAWLGLACMLAAILGVAAGGRWDRLAAVTGGVGALLLLLAATL